MDIHSVIADHRSRRKRGDIEIKGTSGPVKPTSSEIPDLFFDEIIGKYKLSRIEISVLMYLYRKVWCKPNLYRIYGISQILSHEEMSNVLDLRIEEIYGALRKIEEFGFISTIRSGQYFVRKYFTRENDEMFIQTYDDFDI